ncbi:MAG: DUF4179 domain-containing protein [Bacilli bacterium]
MSDDPIREMLVERVSHMRVSPMTWEQTKKSGTRRLIHARRRRRRWAFYQTSAAVFGILCIGTSGFVYPAMGAVLSKIPVVGALYSFYNPKVNEYASKIDPSVTDKGITISVPEVFYDGYQLDITYAIHVPHGYQSIAHHSQLNLTQASLRLNGNHVPFGSAEAKDSLSAADTYSGFASWTLSYAHPPIRGTLTIPIHQVGAVNGNWTLSFPISRQANRKATTSVVTNDPTSTYDGMTLTVKQVRVGPVYTTIRIKLRQSLQSKGAPKYPTNYNRMMFPVFTRNHQFLSSGLANLGPYKTDGHQAAWDVILQYNTPSHHVGSIVIEPKLLQPLTGSTSVKVPITARFPIRVQLPGYAATKIRSIQFDPNQTLVHATIEPNGAAQYLVFWLQSQTGQTYQPTHLIWNHSGSPDRVTYEFPQIPRGEILYAYGREPGVSADHYKNIPQLDITVPLK